MRARAVGQATWQRIQRPAIWGAVLLFGAAWDLARWVLGGPVWAPVDLLLPFLWAACLLVATPVPWQWSGEDSPQARPWRGILQAIPWNAAWILGLLLVVGGGPARMPGPGPGRGPMGRGVHRIPRTVRPGLPLPIHPRGGLLILAGLSAAVVLGWILAEKERAEALARDSRRTAAAAQARALQAQMNPHVLFNAIGGLTELVREDPEAAERALVSLADLLRDLLDLGACATVPLARERELVARYLALEGLRLGGRLRVVWQWDAALESLEVPPLLLQPLVENALKHGIAPNRAGGELRISLAAAPEGVDLEVANTGLPLAGDAPEGVGLRNLRERLELLGLPGSAFRLIREGEWTRAVLRLPRRGGTP